MKKQTKIAKNKQRSKWNCNAETFLNAVLNTLTNIYKKDFLRFFAIKVGVFSTFWTWTSFEKTWVSFLNLYFHLYYICIPNSIFYWTLFHREMDFVNTNFWLLSCSFSSTTATFYKLTNQRTNPENMPESYSLTQ